MKYFQKKHIKVFKLPFKNFIAKCLSVQPSVYLFVLEIKKKILHNNIICLFRNKIKLNNKILFKKTNKF